MTEKKVKRIFLVDDEPMVLRALKRVLRQEGYEIRAFDSAEAALAELEHTQPHCLVSDYYMPRMDGIDFLAQVHRHYPQVFRVMLTGGYLDDRVRQAMENGDIHLLIRKPWRVEDIRRLLEAVEQGQQGIIEQAPHRENDKPAEVSTQEQLEKLDERRHRQPVLVVDDEENFIELMKAWLEQLGFEALKAERAEPVLELIREHDPAAVIVDLILPGTDGLELIGAIRDLHPALPLIAITGGRERDLGLEAFRRGATAFLQKPFELATLEATLRRCLHSAALSRKPSSSRELQALLEIQHAIASRLPAERLLQLMLQLLLRYSDAESASALLVNPDGRTLRLAAAYGLDESLLEQKTSIPIDEGVAGWVIRYNEPQIIVGQPAGDPRLASGRHNPASLGLVLPLRGSRKVIGTLCLTRHQTPQPFPREVVDLGLLVGSEVARALEKLQEEERRQQMERNLMQRDKLATIGELASGVAHEINNPLGYISSNLSTLKSYLDELMPLLKALHPKDGAPDLEAVGRRVREINLAEIIEDLPQCLEETRQGAERVLRIVADLKMMSRSDTDVKEMASLNEIIERAISILWNQIKYRAELVRVLGDLPPYPCYPTQLGQVFLNLLHNAVQAIPHHGTITVRSRKLADALVIEVEDDGAGIPEEIKDRLFEPFFTTKPRGVGTGLGLSIVRKIIARHEGRIEVESEPGRGSLFRVILPWPAPGTGASDENER